MRALAAAVMAVALAGCVTPEQKATQHDAYCRSIGASPGTDGYMRCRLAMVDQLRAENENRRRAFLEGLDDMERGLSMMQRSQPRRTSCDRTHTGFDCRTY